MKEFLKDFWQFGLGVIVGSVVTQIIIRIS